MNPIIELTDVTKTYHSKGKSVLAVKDVTLPVQQGSFTTFIGPSGCGKSTLLKIIAGIALPYEGELRYKGREITSINTDIGFVTQDSNLFPWLTLIENVELALKIRGQPKAQRAEAAQKYIATMQLAGFEDHYPLRALRRHAKARFDHSNPDIQSRHDLQWTNRSDRLMHRRGWCCKMSCCGFGIRTKKPFSSSRTI